MTQEKRIVNVSERRQDSKMQRSRETRKWKEEKKKGKDGEREEEKEGRREGRKEEGNEKGKERDRDGGHPACQLIYI